MPELAPAQAASNLFDSEKKPDVGADNAMRICSPRL